MHGINHLLPYHFVVYDIYLFSSSSKELSSCKDAAATMEEQYNAELSTVSFQILLFPNLEGELAL